MKYIINIVFFFLCNLIVTKCVSQSFQNGDLEGVVTGISCLPNYWQNVPFDDVNCLGAQIGNDTPDLTNLIGPVPTTGAIGNPYSGNTFVSGIFANAQPNFFQEGIMQNIQNLVLGQAYSVRLRQTVSKANQALDKSGSWAIYIDTVLAGVTIPTYSNEPFNSINLQWEARSITFTATSTSHLVKFLPMDDDTNWAFSNTDTTGALYMGIDSISLSIVTGIEEMLHESAIRLYPNPASDVLRIEMQNQFAGTITVTNALGKVFYQNSTERNSSHFSIDLREFPPGLYFVSFWNEGGGVNKRFVKN
jgi:hypothetical protein